MTDNTAPAYRVECPRCGWFSEDRRYGLVWHWGHGCTNPGRLEVISDDDLGIEREPIPIERWEDITLWRCDFAGTTYGDYETLDECHDEVWAECLKAAEKGAPIPRLDFYSIPGKRRIKP